MDEIPLYVLKRLHEVSMETGRPVQVDWVNRTISVLSEMKTHPTKVISSGPMQYQDIIYQYSG